MGQSIEKTQFTEQDFAKFRDRLDNELSQLRKLLNTPGFGVGQPSFGAELELYAINEQAHPVCCNKAILAEFNHPQLTLELNKFNLEYNLAPVAAAGAPFSTLQTEMETMLQRLGTVAANHHASILPIGILPTLKTADIGLHAMTDEPRYHVLAKALRDKRGSDFHIRIAGIEKLNLHWSDVTLEGANTSFQFHYRVDPVDFRDAFNAAQLVTPLGLALAANSPVFLGKKLWHETRVALFKQSIDCRMEDPLSMRLPARVLFGHGWVREDVHELFSESIYLFEPLFPFCDEEPLDAMPPKLSGLRLHQGSIWCWNRPIYDPSAGGHLRIELRSLPAGPTPTDMLSTSAVLIGLIEAIRPFINSILPGIPFRYAEHNFYRAAKDGLNAHLFWPNIDANKLEERPVVDILEELLPLAATGLKNLKVSANEISHYLGVAEQTLEQRQNGAIWQLEGIRVLESRLGLDNGLIELVKQYQENYLRGTPVSHWPKVK
ncbi:hypothetical protein BTA51_05505 [Hahella sp. CCB-MM4]|uniref:hypothetical protein n=1 Tax=Hahella sp. (strain CCB-MM4) TaxID=1926491 RepID=UPI000B9A3EF2|nr:hypothetical protein [Hahella sp. CCB-MM4]OZG74462.1 hypothetical protein BTA51_05505 [Hahella sp. CCB-MM4]